MSLRHRYLNRVRHRARLARALIAILILIAATPAAASGEPANPLDRQLRLNLWGVSLRQTAEEIKTQIGVSLDFSPYDIQREIDAADVFIVTGRVRLGAVMEGLARRFGFRYRVSREGRIEVARGYAWNAHPALCLIRLDWPGAGDPDAVAELLSEFLKPLPLIRGEFSFELERYPLPDNPDALRARAVLPTVMANYLERAVACLSGESGDYPLLPDRTAKSLFARARHAGGGNWEALLGQPLRRPRGDDLKAVLNDVATQTGVAFILSGHPSREGAYQQSQPGDRPALGQVTSELADAWGLGRRIFMPCGAVLFEDGAGGDFEIDTRSREMFWSGLAVAGFDAKRAAEAAGGPDALVTRIRRTVYPSLWRDPMCSLVYSPATGRLAAIVPANILPEIANILAAPAQ